MPWHISPLPSGHSRVAGAGVSGVSGAGFGVDIAGAVLPAFFASCQDAVILRDRDGVVIGWNMAAEQLFGWSATEIIGAPAERFFIPDPAEDAALRARLIAGERVGQFLTQRCNQSGEPLDVVMTISPVHDAGGALIAFGEVVRDARRFLEQQHRLAESEHHFRMLADNISQLAWIAHGDGHIFWYNQRWHDYTGCTLDEMEGWGWQKIHHPDHVDRVTEHFRASIARGDEWEDTFPLRSHEGEWRWFLSRAKPIRDGGDKVEYWFGTNTDITEEREQAEQIRLLLMEVNHRSKNLLGTVQALARRTAPGNAAFLDRFEDRMRSLAVNQDILVKREWRQVPVRELVEAQLAFVEQAPGEITIEGPGLSLLPRAAETIGMALHELATNALKYGSLSVGGGHVAIGWSVSCPAKTGVDTGAEAKTGFTIWWRESNGPAVTGGGSEGFGTKLIRDVPRHNLAGEVLFDHRPEGICWQLHCPLDQVTRPLGSTA